VNGSESLAFPASSIALAVTDRAFEAFPFITGRPRPPAAHEGSPTVSDGLPLANPARGRVATPARPPGSLRAVSIATPETSACRTHHPKVVHSPDASVVPGACLLEVPSTGSPLDIVYSRHPTEVRYLWPTPARASVSFRPRGFSPPRRLAPMSAVWTLLQSTAGRGVHRILDDGPPAPPDRGPLTSTTASFLRYVTPLEDAPRQQHARRSRRSPKRTPSHAVATPSPSTDVASVTVASGANADALSTWFCPLRARPRGLAPLAGLWLPSAVADDQQRCSPMGFFDLSPAVPSCPTAR
jgi:hypothetical protein